MKSELTSSSSSVKRSTNTLTTASAIPGSIMSFATVTRLALLDLPTWNIGISSLSRRILLLLNKISAGSPCHSLRMSYPSNASSSISAIMTFSESKSGPSSRSIIASPASLIGAPFAPTNRDDLSNSGRKVTGN
ncbi:hypothetical protein DPMN_110519 [Dreissena polymorpha]|uniref:Uncharacterized protein n=1 Tax=Dreissena polymorpha TaxID=45954 RepID=A0A9D4KC60_DREPO|nr:hypothetical protein DPMN_110519 [Dreissena polymorpha]